MIYHSFGDEITPEHYFLLLQPEPDTYGSLAGLALFPDNTHAPFPYVPYRRTPMQLARDYDLLDRQAMTDFANDYPAIAYWFGVVTQAGRKAEAA